MITATKRANCIEAWIRERRYVVLLKADAGLEEPRGMRVYSLFIDDHWQ
jgi:hypothetical protein